VDPETLTEILRGRHLSVPERIRRKAWPHPPLSMAHLIEHLEKVLEHEDFFPDPKMGLDGDSVAEGVFIEKQGPHRFVCTSRLTFPVLKQSQRSFARAADAAAFYLRWGLQLPGDLDGWKVIV
jgi:hypothetical protein